MNVDKLIEKAEEAAKKKNYDYAISIFLQAVAFAPNDRRAREGLRNAELKKYEKGYPSALTVSISGLGARIGIFFAGMGRKKNPEGFMLACEKYLVKDPKNKKVNMLLGDSAAEAGHLKTAVFAYETAAETDPNDVTALKHLGNLLWRNNEIVRAHEVFSRVVHLNPQDQEAIKARKNLAAEASLKKTGYETAKSSRELIKDKEAAGKLEQDVRIYRPEEDLAEEQAALEEKLKAAPDDEDILSELSETLRKKKDYAEAAKVLDKILAKKPDDDAVLTRRGELRILDLESRAAALKREGKAEEAKREERKLLEFRTEEFERRVQAHPTDLKARFGLADNLLALGRQDEAIAQFQQTVRDPKYRAESRLRLGLAFAAKGVYDLAVRQLEQALEGQTGMSDRVKEIRYALGDVYARSGDVEKARLEFAQIYESDINYRDVADRLAKLSGSSEKGGGAGTLSLQE